MRLREMADLLGCDVVWGEEELDRFHLDACFAADLMSDVLAFSRPGALLITGLTSIQSAHTAHVADLAAILYVAAKKPAAPVLDLARENGIPLLTTKFSMFDTCGILYNAGLKAACRSTASA
jgi:predicted transcriptional regulator